MDLSIVTTLYHSAPYIEEFYQRMVAAAENCVDSFEIVFVDDGSPDDSGAIAKDIIQKDARVKLVELSRNFGHHKAIMTGLAHTSGKRVFLIDCDLEEEPENLPLFQRQLDAASDADVVYGALESRKGGLLAKAASSSFHCLLSFLIEEKYDITMAFSRLLTKRYVESLLRHEERELYLVGIWHITGYKQISIPITASHKGATTYTLRKRIALAVNAITSFSNRPLIYIFKLGLLIASVSGAYILYLVVRLLVFADTQHGWTSLIVSIWFMGGLLMLSIGIVGIYLSKIFIETKHRPYTIVRKIYENEDG